MNFTILNIVMFLCIIASCRCDTDNENDDEFQLNFPSDFKFGAATSSYQIEGAWNEDGKGPSIWDTFTHGQLKKSPIADGSNADVSANSYHLYQQDVSALSYVGVSAANLLSSQ